MNRLRMEPIGAEATKRTRDPDADVPTGIRHRRPGARGPSEAWILSGIFEAARDKAQLASSLATMI